MFKKLIVWQKAFNLCTEIHRITPQLIPYRQYDLIRQMNRAAISIVSNIAEGARRKTGKDFAYFLSIAQGSCAELETQLMICHSLQYITSKTLSEALKKITEINKMLHVLHKNKKGRT